MTIMAILTVINVRMMCNTGAAHISVVNPVQSNNGFVWQQLQFSWSCEISVGQQVNPLLLSLTRPAPQPSGRQKQCRNSEVTRIKYNRRKFCQPDNTLAI